MILKELNDIQRNIVTNESRRILVLSCPGSGKTKVLTHKIAYNIQQGANPDTILAVTFTNKAAKEMKNRIHKLVGSSANSCWIGTFHSICVRILARFGPLVGVHSGFTIFDNKDQLKLLKQAIKDIGIENDYKIESLNSAISYAKNILISPEDLLARANNDFRKYVVNVYIRYQELLSMNNGLDFDDLIFKVVRLLEQNKHVRTMFQNKFKYILVDEIQDINDGQYRLLELLCVNNLFAIGDVNQSIYGFRGSNMSHALNLQKLMKTEVINMEQNYRSTSNIVNAANAIITNNNTTAKSWTKNNEGSQIVLYNAEDEVEEAEFVTSIIKKTIELEKREPSDFTVLYRTNTQSRIIEETLLSKGIPYQIVGNLAFYERKEVKDTIAYLRIITNEFDTLALSRIINVPKRGIGDITVSKIDKFARENEITLYEALNKVEEIKNISNGTKEKLKSFCAMIKDLRELSQQEGIKIVDIINEVWHRTQYIDILRDDGTEESATRVDNLRELYKAAEKFWVSVDEPSISSFLSSISLLTDQDKIKDNNTVKLMTVHTSKGLEFPVVFMIGMEEGIFPHVRSLGQPEDLQEERRLYYVGITRAKEKLYLSNVRLRLLMGITLEQSRSRFLEEIPDSLLKEA